MLKIYNTLTRSKQEFVPLTPGKVNMYVCGITVYDYLHLGHARMMVAFDVVQRWLRASGYDVTHVRNITDIEDKIIKRAHENNEPPEALTARFIKAMDDDAAALGIEKPDHEPRATQYVQGMIDMIEVLRQRGLAYQASDGDVNYAVRKFEGYGKLSGKSLDDLRAGERVQVDMAKDDPLDFVLWKRSKEGEPSWDSPWGKGRPGWHIECSVMSNSLLGKHFDIHGGGQDLQFPHHENEIAQSEGAHQCTFVNTWMHNGFVRVDDEKMSKSLGNFFTVREILAKYDPEVVRFFIIRAQYRSPLNYSDHHLDDAKQGLTRLYTALKEFDVVAGDIDWSNPHAIETAQLLKSLAAILGLLQRSAQEFLQNTVVIMTTPGDAVAGGVTAHIVNYTPEVIDRLIDDRVAARKAKNFAESDRIRKELLDVGIVLEDGPKGTTWRRS